MSTTEKVYAVRPNKTQNKREMRMLNELGPAAYRLAEYRAATKW